MQALLVEDHTDTRSVLATLLNRCGCHTIPAKNLQEARSLLGEMKFDFLISDLNLPDGDGIALMQEAKKAQALTAIALTGRASDEERAQGLEAGFDHYLTKPIDLHELRLALGLQRDGCGDKSGPN